MGLVDAFPMRQISKVGDPASLYAELLAQIVRLAQHGLIHGDFNEFNVLVEERPDGELIPTIIDFPQMVSIDHANAEFYFDRDVACIKRFFDRRFGFTSDEPGPFLKDSIKRVVKRLDVEVQASGFSKKMAKELELYMKEHGIDGDADAEGAPAGADEDADENEQVKDVQDEDEEVPAPEELDASQEDTAPPVQPPTQDSDTTTPSKLASQMTILDIRDNDPLPDLGDIKPPSQPTITTKAAKKKAGWAI
jgi:RIO kinase 2